MKKSKFIGIIILLALLTGCGLVESVFGPAKRDAEDIEDLSISVNKSDEEEGLTLDNSEVYEDLVAYAEHFPQQSEPNEVTFMMRDVHTLDDGKDYLVFLAENRFAREIENIEVDMTLGLEDGDYIVSGETLKLTKEEYGTLKSDYGTAFYLEVDEEDIEIAKELDENNVDFQLTNLSFDYVK